MAKKTMIFNPHHQIVEFDGEISVLELAQREKLPLNESCGGMGTCGTCLVVVESSLEELPPRNSVEQEIANDREYRANERLACQTRAQRNLKVKIP